MAADENAKNFAKRVTFCYNVIFRVLFETQNYKKISQKLLAGKKSWR